MSTKLAEAKEAFSQAMVNLRHYANRSTIQQGLTYSSVDELMHDLFKVSILAEKAAMKLVNFKEQRNEFSRTQQKHSSITGQGE